MSPSKLPRPRGHALIWMAITRGQCECGEDLVIPAEDAEGSSDDEVRDMVLDRHSDHLVVIRERRG